MSGIDGASEYVVDIWYSVLNAGAGQAQFRFYGPEGLDDSAIEEHAMNLLHTARQTLPVKAQMERMEITEYRKKE